MPGPGCGGGRALPECARGAAAAGICAAARGGAASHTGVFFAAVALLLAGIGLYGVLNYSVLQRRREIAIRVAVGARGASIARLVTGDVFSMVAVGVVAGVGLGLASARYMEGLFFQVKASDASILAVPSAVVLAVAVVATVPAILRALRIDPVEILRAE
jgi:ABC-type antimicrobial peptide transport system permease subunit